MHERKGQAAMEFLMTYGWAILAAIIAIGVLAYFGVFSPGKYTSGSAVVNPPFYANAWNIQADYDKITAGSQDGINIELRNNGGEDYEVRNISISSCGSNGTIAFINASKAYAVVVPCDNPTTILAEGKTFKGDITITYNKSGSIVDLTSTGTIAEKITA
ncbi:hypothetical protein KW787_01920 [Candidatus Pacearchaeota archaeon]|nr:hypothetical protein [Candidatus Pacearchaeota archaeon]